MIRKNQINLIKSGKIKIKSPEEKSHSSYGAVVASTPLSSNAANNMLITPFSMAGRFGWYNLRSQAAWSYYKELSVIRDACDMSAEAFATIPFGVKNNKTGEILTDFDKSVPATQILELLNKPNQAQTESEFRISHNTTYNVTGDTFFLTTSIAEDSEPLEIYYINSNRVSETTNNDDIAISYQINTGMFRGSYRKHELDDGRIIYQNEKSSAQLWILKTFNPDQGSGSSRGFSKLSSIFYEIESHTGVSKHNNALLRNGARPSGAVIPNTPEGSTGSNLSDDQINSLKSSIQSFYGGYENAGNVMVLDGIKEFKELSQNSKDSEFSTLVDRTTVQIYNNLRIPLPLKNTKTMTLRNFEEAKLMLFELNTIPFSICYAEELNRFLMPRFDDSGDYTYVVDIDKIPALEVRKMEKIDKFKDSMTDNEKRELIGLKPAPDGDKIRGPVAPAVMSNPTDKSKKDFIDSLRDTGKFNEDQIQSKADSIYGGE